jgi:hypothetical protein
MAYMVLISITKTLRPEEERGWFDAINPFSGRSGRGEDGDCGDYNNQLSSSSSLGMPRSMTLRAITMRDFEIAVMKSKEAKAHCGGQMLRQRLELD